MLFFTYVLYCKWVNTMENTIKITMFKDFTLEFHNQKVAFDKVATRQMTSLLQMLIYHKNGISKEELINELWQDNANPLNALKYSIFRLRAALDEIDCFRGVELISTIKNGYKFAPNFEIISDYSLIDEHFKVLNDPNKTKKEIAKSALEIISLYKGQFYMNDSSIWGMQVRSYYQNVYEKAFIIVCEDFIESKNAKEAIPIIHQAIEIDKFFDDAYVYNLKVLIEVGKYNEAMQLYKHINSLYENEFGHAPSLKIKSMYRILSSREEEVIDLEVLKKKLNEDMQTSSALYCDYETFKYIYHATLNNARRDYKKEFLLVFQLNSKEDDKKQLQYMSKLKTIMCTSLRSGDVLSKINKSQIIALLPCESIDNGYGVIQRITSAFYKKVNKENAKLHYFISSLNEFDENITEK